MDCECLLIQMYLGQLAIAIALVSLLILQIVKLYNKSTSIGMSMMAIVISFAAYGVLMVPAAEKVFADVTSITSVSSLAKDLLLISLGYGCLLMWKSLNAFRRLSRIMYAISFLNIVLALHSWLTYRPVCGEIFQGFYYDMCVFRYLDAAALEIFRLSILIIISIITIIILTSGINVKRRDSGSLIFTVLAATVATIWIALSLIGVIEIYNFGDLNAYQYALRPFLVVLCSIFMAISLLYGPIMEIIDDLIFSRRISVLLELLDIESRTILGTIRVVDIMDAIGAAAEVESIKIIPSSDIVHLEHIAQLLRGEHVSEIHVPVYASIDMQKKWLLSVAGYIYNEEKDSISN